jgi:hypothetical protein
MRTTTYSCGEFLSIQAHIVISRRAELLTNCVAKVGKTWTQGLKHSDRDRSLATINWFLPKGYEMINKTLVILGLFGVVGVTSATRAIAQNNALHPERRGIGISGFVADDFQGRAIQDIKPLAVKARKTVEVRRSLFITEKKVLDRFTFAEVMQRLGEKSIPSVSKEQLFDAWWSSANVRTATSVGCGPASLKPGDHSTLFGFDYQCPRAEGSQSSAEAFDDGSENRFVPIALVNRFDLASAAESGRLDCGEYRIVFARKSGKEGDLNRVFIIFEAVLPNPTPGKLSGCLPIVQLWAELTTIATPPEVRAEKLHNFYFNGITKSKIAAVVEPSHYGNATKFARGQIRTNQFLQFGTGFDSNWMLREFTLLSDGVRTAIVPDTAKSNPPAVLFGREMSHPLAKEFQERFTFEALPKLMMGSINTFGFPVLDKFNTGESDEQKDTMLYFAIAKENDKLRSAISSARPQTSTIGYEAAVNRAQALTCAGCHRLSAGAELEGGLGQWPPSLGFVHQSESKNDPDVAVESFEISSALKKVFLPFRKCVMEAFLNAETKKCT